MTVLKVDFVGIRTDRLDETVALFRDVLGVSVTRQTGDLVGFRFADGTVLELYSPANQFHGFLTTGPVVALRVDNFDVARQTMLAAGVKFIGNVQHADGISWQHFYSPDGTVLEISGMRKQNNCMDEITIGQLRDQSNAAIARHEVGPAVAIHHDHARIIGSDGSLLDGAAAIARAFAASFADPDFVAYVRRPVSITVNGSIAAETGNWTGQWRQREVRGTYMARWSREPAGWRIVAELFIPLGQSPTP